MATLYGVNRTKLNLPIGSSIIAPGQNKAKICYMYDEYEASAADPADVIHLCDRLPKDAVITKITLLTDNLTGSATVDIGDVADDDRYASAVDISGQATTYIWPETAAAANIANYGYRVGTATNDDQLMLTVNTSAITGTIKFGVEYAI